MMKVKLLKKVFGINLYLIFLCYSGCIGAKSDLWDPETIFGLDSNETEDDSGEEDYVQSDPIIADENQEESPAEEDFYIDYLDIPFEGDFDPCSLPCNDGIDCTEDTCNSETGCVFTPKNERCNDHIDCTLDWCDSMRGCIYTEVNERCDDGISCTIDSCISGRGCQSIPQDSLCSDGISCTTERCDPSSGGCIVEPHNEMCSDGISCTLDICNLSSGCTSTPDDGLCPEGQKCVPACGGCILDVAPPGNFLAHSSSSLYRVNPSALTSTYIGDIGFTVTDIAVTSDNILWGITYSSLISIDYCTGIGRYVGDVGGTWSLNALVSAPGPVLYGADTNGNVWRIDPATGRGTRIGNYGFGLSSSGDIAWGPDGLLYATTRSGSSSSDILVSVNPSTGSARIIGITGFASIYGLAVMDGILYGLTDLGELLRIDTTTGRATLLGVIGSSFWGAASPPR